MSTSMMALGLAKKAGKVIVGAPLVVEAVRSKRPPSLVIVSREASDNTKKKLYDKCKSFGVNIYETDAATECLSHALGGRASVACAAICDAGLAELFLRRAANESKRNEE